VLVANKYDLEGDAKKVAYEQGEEMAKQYGMPFFETSAKTARPRPPPYHARVLGYKYSSTHGNYWYRYFNCRSVHINFLSDLPFIDDFAITVFS
jgi:hypothetical protein